MASSRKVCVKLAKKELKQTAKYSLLKIYDVYSRVSPLFSLEGTRWGQGESAPYVPFYFSISLLLSPSDSLAFSHSFSSSCLHSLSVSSCWGREGPREVTATMNWSCKPASKWPQAFYSLSVAQSQQHPHCKYSSL